MRILALLLILFATSVSAETLREITWGNPENSIYYNESKAVLHDCEEADICLTVSNGYNIASELETIVLFIDDHEFILTQTTTIGANPDIFRLDLPVGFTVEPMNEAVVEEYQQFVFRIFYPVSS